MYYNNDHENTEAFNRAPVSGEYRYTPNNNNSSDNNNTNTTNNGSNPTDGTPKPGFFQRNRGKKPSKPPKPPKMKAKKSSSKKPLGTGGIVAIALVCALVGGCIGGGIAMASGGFSSGATNIAVSDRNSTGGTDVQATKVKAGEVMTSSQIYSKYGDCVVSVNVKTSQGEGAGTGFLISKDGYILTCNHVISGAAAISVVLTDSTSYEAKLVGSDEDLDVAVLKIQGADKTTFPSVVLCDSNVLTVGDSVTAIGNALGTLANTLTTGVVSALDRAISMSDGTAMSLLQTDCTVNSGNSGGPLFNQYGEVIGIVNAKYSSSNATYTSEANIEGIGFAIPINNVQDILSDLMKYGYVTGKPYLGITVSTVSSITAQQYSNMVVGAYVNSVEKGSCAETSGLKTGDIVTQVDSKDITTSAELIDAKNSHKSGEEMTLTVYRDNDYTTLKVTLDEEQPDSDDSTSDNQDSDENNDDTQGNSSQSGDNYYYSWPFSNDGNGNRFPGW